MRPECIAELRDVAEDALSWVKDTENVRYRIEEAGIPDPDGVRVLARAIQQLLDELWACDAQVDGFRARCDSLAAQVAVFREALQDIINGVPPIWDGMHLVDCPYVELFHDSRTKAIAVLSDTEAAATTWLEAHDREQRLKGARDLFARAEARLSLPTKASYYLDALTAELEAMEDEANGNEH